MTGWELLTWWIGYHREALFLTLRLQELLAELGAL